MASQDNQDNLQNPDLPSSQSAPPQENGFRPLKATQGTTKRRRSVAANADASPQPASGQPTSNRSVGTPSSTPVQPASKSFEPIHQFTLRQGDGLRPTGGHRAQRWQAFPPLKTVRLQQAQLFTVLALPLIPIGLHGGWFVLTHFVAMFSSRVLRWGMAIPQYQFPVPGLFGLLLGWANGFGSVTNDLAGLAHLLDVVVWLVLTFLAAPYFLDWAMGQWYGMQPLSSARLAQISQEAQRRLQTATQQQKIPMPKLGLVPTSAPIAFAYGSTPKTVRIVVSQGFLDQLDEDEIAAIYSAESSQISLLNMGLMSWVMAILQVPYLIYWLTAQVGDAAMDWASDQSNRALEILGIVGAYGIAAFSSVAYASFWCLRWAGLWLARRRSFYADHAASNLTGNPNAQARALLKMAHGISQTIQTQGQTDFLLEGWELLMPVGYRNALTFGSLLNVMPIEQTLEWDLSNPQRQILTVNNSHALMGDRLMRLMHYAQTWQLSPELELGQLPSPKALTWNQLFWAGAPFFGAAIGYGSAVIFWAIAWLGYLLNFRMLSWLGSDFRLFYALPLMGFGLGTFLRFNSYFPDLPAAWQRRSSEANVSLAEIVQDSLAIPNKVSPTTLSGKLLGRQGISNWLGQDLLLQTKEGVVRLHHSSGFGVLGNWAFVNSRPADFIGQSVNVAGWLRRGATPWFDLEILRNQSGRGIRGGHQIWSAVVMAIALILGLLWLGVIEDLISVIQKISLMQKLQNAQPLLKKP